MADNSWEIATIVLAALTFLVALLVIPLFISERGNQFVGNLRDKFYKKIRPETALCKKLLWNDISALHTCVPENGCQQPPHLEHQATARCYRETLRSVFDFDWDGLVQVPKPWELDSNREFLRTDVRTILAFLLCSANSNSTPQYNFNERRLQLGEIDIVLNDCNVVLVAHIRSANRPITFKIAKKDVDMIASGYPPFYRENFDLGFGDTLSFPIKEERDTQRGGWVIAVGLMPVETVGSRTLKEPPLAVFIDNDGSGSSMHSQSRPFIRALRRVHDVIAKYFSAAFPEDTSINSVVAKLNVVTKNERFPVSSLDLNDILSFASTLIREEGKNMTRTQCEMAMNVFNSSTPLTSEQVDQLKPVLNIVLNVALNGVCRVIEYSWDSKRLVLPQSLRDRNRAVYLRDCLNDSPD